jgi:hypothetical protein
MYRSGKLMVGRGEMQFDCISYKNMLHVRGWKCEWNNK